jgi:nucleoside-diphosphate-sugar epimerase
MRIFVAGASGAIGRPLVSALIAAGHSVTGLTRTAAKAEILKRQGAESVIADGLDEDAMRSAVGSAKPDVVIHEMTDLTGTTDLRHFDRTFASSNRLRTRGIDILLTAAREAGAKRIIAQSYCG